MSAPTSPPDSTIAARVAGACGAAMFAGISSLSGGFKIGFHPPFARVDPGEANLWLAFVLLAFPSACLLGYGFRRELGWFIDRVHRGATALSAREQRLVGVTIALLAVTSARLSNHLVLGGFPITDDEWAARFGGEVLAQGRVLMRLPFEQSAFPTLYMFIRDGQLSSMDWLGAQLAWAIAALSGLDGWVFALSAAIPVPCVMWVVARRLSFSWALAAGALLLSSPMAFALSMTSHAHLQSRALLAAALAAFVRALERRTRGAWLLVGLALGGR